MTFHSVTKACRGRRFASARLQAYIAGLDFAEHLQDCYVDSRIFLTVGMVELI